MQIDFHHAVTYVVSRLGGLDREKAEIVAHAAQYVDDATNDGAIDFSDGERYIRVTSAHKAFDLRNNSDRADNRLVWVPFHFLPGNQPTQETDANEAFIRRMVCKPGSAIAMQMVADCVIRQDLPFALHRLGIALHTFADTWAHQEFVGIICDYNKIRTVTISPDPAYAAQPIFSALTDGSMKLKAFIAGHLPVGHATALTYPDMPFLKWSFVRENGETVVRDNPSDFVAAAKAMFNVVRRYVAKDLSLVDSDIPAKDAAAIDRLLRTTLAIEGEDRHGIWVDAIANGKFSFGKETPAYVDRGANSWKIIALGADPDEETDEETFSFTPQFLTSNWKMFHDAVQFHRLYVLHELLPKFQLSAS